MIRLDVVPLKPLGWHSRVAVVCTRRTLPLFVMLIAMVHTLSGCRDRAAASVTAPSAGDPQTPPAAAANVAPSSQFAISPRWPAPGDTVTFDAMYSHDGDGQVQQYRWSLGNGIAQTSSAVARTVFRSAGTYTVSLTTIDDVGDSTTTSMSLVVAVGGAPASAVSAAQSRLTLSAGSVAGGATVTATVTSRTAAGGVISGAAIGVAAAGRRITLSPQSGTSSGAGSFTTSVGSPIAQSTIVRAVVDFTALVDTVALTMSPAATANASSVRLTQTTLASVYDSAFVEITARDTAGNAVSGVAVTLSGSPGGLVVSNEGTTDANGRRIVTVKSIACATTHTLTAIAGGVTLTTSPTIALTGTTAYGACGPALWLDASDASSITKDGSNRVSQWNDKSGMLRHAVQGTTSAMPVATASLINGRNGMAFTSARSIVSPGVLTGMSNASEVFIVALPDSTALGGFVFGHIENSNQRYSAHLPFNDGVVYWDFGTCCGAPARTQVSVGVGNAASRPSVWSMGSMPSSTPERHIRRDGLALVTGSGTASLTYTTTEFFLGSSWTGAIAEMLIFPRALTSGDRVAIERALMIKWGIGTLVIDQGNSQSANVGTTLPISPRVRITDGAGNALAGATVTFQITAGGGSIGTTTATTDGSGYASTSWTMGSSPGTQTLVAWYNTTAGAGQKVTFTATAQSCAYTVCGTQLWFDASDNTTITTSGSTLTAWADKSGYARNASPTAGPTMVAANIYGRQALQFNGTSQFVPLTDVVGGTPYTVFAVSRRRAAGAYVLGGSSGGTNTNLVFGFRNSTQATLAHYFNDINGTIPAFTSAAAEPPVVLSGRWQSGARSLNINASTLASDATTNGVSSWVNAAIARHTGTFNALDLGEVIIYNRAVSDAERGIIERALMAKWGIGTLTKSAGDAQNTTAGTSPTTDPQVRITDATGTGIPSATVVFQVTGGGGRVNGGTTYTTTTNASGYASVPNAWVLDYGSNSLTAWYNSTAGSGQSVVFTGTGTLPANLEMQYNADNAAALYKTSSCSGALAAVGDSVGCWIDASSNARHVTQTTAASRPTVATFGSTGRTALSFVLTRDNWLESSASGISAVANGPRTIVAAARANATEDNSTNYRSAIVMFAGYNSGLSYGAFPTVNAVAAEQWASASSGGNYAIGYATGYTANTSSVISQVLAVSGGNFSATGAINGAVSTTQTVSGTPSGYGNLMRIGMAGPGGSTFRWRLDGQIAEVLIFSRALSSAERLSVERYLGWKWGVTIP